MKIGIAVLYALVSVAPIACRNVVPAGGNDVPDAAIAGCTGSGLLAGRNSNKACPVYPADITQAQIFFSSTTSGDLPACSNIDPNAPGGFTFEGTVESMTSTSEPNRITTMVTVLGAGVAVPCRTTINFVHPVFKVVGLNPGDSIAVSQRRTQTSDVDVRYTSVIRSKTSGDVLYAAVTGARPDFFDTDLLDMNLSVDSASLCQWTFGGGGSMTRIHLVTAGADCGVDALTSRCCTVWTKPYRVAVQSAGLGQSNLPSPFVSFDVMTPGFATSGP